MAKAKDTIVANRALFGRNESWVQSALIGLKVSLFYAPERLVGELSVPFVAALSGAGLFVFSLVWFIAETVLIIAAGLFGQLRPLSANVSQE